MAFMTIFSAPKPFTNPHIALIQRNAIRSWLALGNDVQVVLIGEEEGVAEAAAELGAQYVRDVRRNAQGTPLVSAMFDCARQMSDTPLLCCINADIILLPDVLDAARRTAAQTERFLIVGQRWDLDVTEPLDYSEGYAKSVMARCQQQGRRHPRGGSDYFIFPRHCFVQIPDLAIGRAGWDNWMIYAARQHGWATVDASDAITIIHQDHDYGHLPNGQPHYRLPESLDNIRLGGGRRTIFTLLDTDRYLTSTGLVPPPQTWKKFWREVEIFPLVHLHSYPLGQVFFALFHPHRWYYEVRRGMH